MKPLSLHLKNGGKSPPTGPTVLTAHEARERGGGHAAAHRSVFARSVIALYTRPTRIEISMRHELLWDADFHSHREAQQAILEFIEHWYNPERRHSTLGYVSPLQYEHQLRQMARAA